MIWSKRRKIVAALIAVIAVYAVISAVTKSSQPVWKPCENAYIAMSRAGEMATIDNVPSECNGLTQAQLGQAIDAATAAITPGGNQ
jgi:hypothetical protein